jgi:hypothetical protein
MDREELARVLYEAPFGTLALSNWPPAHPDDREYWLTRADAVLERLTLALTGLAALRAKALHDEERYGVGYAFNQLLNALDADAVLAAGWRRE